MEYLFNKDLTQEELKKILTYNLDTGDFVWAMELSFRAGVGKKAGCLDRAGYTVIRIKGKLYKAHRLAWLYMTGEWPVSLIDHINGVKADNRFCNLREATKSQNAVNSHNGVGGEVGYRGVYLNGCGFTASITYNKKRIHIGTFKTAEAASEAYEAKAKKLHGEFYRSTLS